MRFQPWRRARFDMRNHRKIAVLDGKIGYVGSQNLVDRAFKPGIVNRELVARVRGPLVAQLQAVLLADRYYETEERIGELGHFPPFEEAGSVFAQCLPSGPGYSQENNQRLIVSLIHAANERVVLTTPYFIPDEPLYQAMQTAATRGVEVHLVVSRDLDQLLVGYAQRSFYDQLLAAGVQIHIYYEYFLHAKHLSVDGDIALVGSSNFDIRSFALNAGGERHLLRQGGGGRPAQDRGELLREEPIANERGVGEAGVPHAHRAEHGAPCGFFPLRENGGAMTLWLRQ